MRTTDFGTWGNVSYLGEFFGAVLVQIILKKLLLPTTNDSHKSTSMFTFNNGNYNPAGIYMFEVNNRNTRTMCEICSRLTIKTPQRRQWGRSGVFVVNFEYISHLF